MIDKFAGAIKDLRSTLGVTQIEFAKKLGVGVPSLAHYETAGHRPEAATTALLCRAAHDAGRIDLAEVFAAALPGVEDGLLVPCWRLPNAHRPTPSDCEPPTRLLDRFEKPQQCGVCGRAEGACGAGARRESKRPPE